MARPTATRGGLALPPLAWAAAGICAFSPLSGAIKRALNGDLTPYGFAAAVAIAAGFMLLPLAAAWSAWRFGGQRETLRNAAFLTVLGSLVLVAVIRAVSETRARDTAVTAQARALGTQLIQRETGTTAVPTPLPLASPADKPDPAAAIPDAARPIIEAQRAVKARLDALQLAYDLSTDAVPTASFFDLALLASAEAIAARRTQVQAFARANQMLHESASLGAFYFSSELRDRAVPESAVREAVESYRAASKKHLPRLKRVRDKDGALALLMLEFLAFAEVQRGKWRVDDATRAIVFDSPAATTRYEEILRVAKVLETERRQLRDELLDLARPARP